MTERHEIVYQVVQAIAEIEGVPSQDLDHTLYDHIEVDAIKRLVTSKHTGWELTFGVPDHTIAIRGSGQILVDGEVVREGSDTIKETNE